MELEVREGDIAAVEADAIANAANDRLWMGAGVAGALKRAGGDEIEQEAMAIGGIPLGTAVATTAGRLRARWVIHGAVMGQELRTDADLVGRTTRACLRSPRSWAAARSRCPRSARASVASRSPGVPRSWSRRHGCSPRSRSSA